MLTSMHGRVQGLLREYRGPVGKLFGVSTQPGEYVYLRLLGNLLRCRHLFFFHLSLCFVFTSCRRSKLNFKFDTSRHKVSKKQRSQYKSYLSSMRGGKDASGEPEVKPVEPGESPSGRNTNSASTTSEFGIRVGFQPFTM